MLPGPFKQWFMFTVYLFKFYLFHVFQKQEHRIKYRLCCCCLVWGEKKQNKSKSKWIFIFVSTIRVTWVKYTKPVVFFLFSVSSAPKQHIGSYFDKKIFKNVNDGEEEKEDFSAGQWTSAHL